MLPSEREARQGKEPSGCPSTNPAPPARDSAVPGTPVSGGAFVCRRCHKPNPRLEKPPFSNDLGRRIHETICRSCWKEWFAMSIRVINEYRLNLMSPESSAIYDEHMKQFLGLEDAPRGP
jgi:Fe-S cluster biosynthesis and repair protein YggX